MTLSVEKKDNKFRVVWQDFSLDWLPDTPSDRKSILVHLRSLLDGRDNHVFTFQELSVLFDRNNRQASSQHMEDFRECGCYFLQYLFRKGKVDSGVVEAVEQELMGEANLVELQEGVNARLGRKDLTSANIKVALDQISCEQIRDSMQRQLAKGKAHYQEEYLLTEMMESSNAIGARSGESVCSRYTHIIHKRFAEMVSILHGSVFLCGATICARPLAQGTQDHSAEMDYRSIHGKSLLMV